MRLERTGSSASVPHSPLTRKPPGAPGDGRPYWPRMAWLLLLLPLPSCKMVSRAAAMFNDLQSARAAVMAVVPGADVQINLMNGRFLNIVLVNSQLGKLPDDQRKAKAREIAGVAYRGYPTRSSLEAITVTFSVNVDAVVLRYSNATNTFRFSVGEFAANLPTPAVSPSSREAS